ncbi:MAG TPA: hypothetical protein DD435_08555 [Cyanobacteria bacterium UBA8530]|nr:hypothetical protein [Cyanobacteria bacterium UBA8530]
MKERGFALIAALMIGMVLLLVGIGASTYIMNGGRLITQRSEREEVLNVADAGLEWAVNRFDPDSPSAVATSAPFEKGEYEVSSPSILSLNQRYLLKVTAYLPSKANARYSRAVQAIVEASAAPVFDFAMAAGGNVDLAGNITVDSSPVPHQGNVHANGNIVSNGGSLTVDGSSSAHGSNTLGGQNNAPLVEIPGVSSEKIESFYNQAASLGTNTFGTFDESNLSGYYAPASTWAATTPSHTTFSLSGDLTVPDNGVVFIDGDVKLSGNTVINGNATIIVNGKVTISGNVSLGKSSNLSIVSLDSSDDAISVSGNVKVGCPTLGSSPPPAMPSAILFAPNGGIDVTGNPSIFGSLIAGTNGDVKGSATITRISDRQSGVIGFGTWKAINWREVAP